MEIGTFGAWMGAFAVAPAAVARPAAARIEELGFGCIWYPEGMGTRESFTNASVLLGATDDITVASGIMNIWGRDAVACAEATRVLNDAHDGRFLLGLGVSHVSQVAPRGWEYLKPVARMRAYLDAMDGVEVESPDATAPIDREPVTRVLAALRPPMLRLAAARSRGAHPYLVPVEHTRRAREIMGPDAILAPEVKVLLSGGAADARGRARAALRWYLDELHYRANLEWLGFATADFEHGGSDRLVDSLVVWGDAGRIAEGIHAHLAAGASHVAIQPIGGTADPLGLETLERVAAALGIDR